MARQYQPAPEDSDTEMKNLSVMLHLLAATAMFGKAAIGGAGATLAFLGALNIFSDVVLSGASVTGRFLPVIVAAGGVLGGVVGAIKGRS